MKLSDEEMPPLRDLMKYLISEIGYPVGMGIEPSDMVVERIISLVREYDKQNDL